jgi:hypothetical protein
MLSHNAAQAVFNAQRDFFRKAAKSLWSQVLNVGVGRGNLNVVIRIATFRSTDFTRSRIYFPTNKSDRLSFVEKMMHAGG